MNLKEKTFHDGTGRKDRNIAELDVDYVSIEERSMKDILKFILRFAEQLKFYNSAGQPEGNWQLFFGGDPLPGQTRNRAGLTDAEQVYLDDIVDYLQNPGRYEDQPQKLDRYSAPHRVLLLTWLKLLDYARQQFNDLTGRHLDHYYRRVLQLKDKPPAPDRVNLVFRLAQGETEYPLKKHTLFDGGEDRAGNARRYALDNDILLNQAQIARVYTLHVDRRLVDLRSIHNASSALDAGARTDHDFFEMLKWGLGYPNQGDDLPLYPNNDAGAGDTPVDLASLRQIHDRLRGLDYAAAVADRQEEAGYVTGQLHFPLPEDFIRVMDLNARQQDANPLHRPGDAEWQQAYRLIEQAFINGRAKSRQGALRTINETPRSGGHISMARHALGMEDGAKFPPFPGDPLETDPVPFMRVYWKLKNSAPGSEGYERARDYVHRNMYMSTDDYLFFMDTVRAAPRYGDPAWQRVYEIFEQAQSARENYSPSVNRVMLQRLTPSVIYAEDNVDYPDCFPTFGETVHGHADTGPGAGSHCLGFAVSSPLLLLKEGKRVVNLDLAFNNQLDEVTSAALLGGFNIEFSGGDDLPWFDARHDGVNVTGSIDANAQLLKLAITLGESAPALVAPVAGAPDFTPAQPLLSPYPVIRLSVKDTLEYDGDDNGLYYSKLKDLQLRRVSLEVTVGAGIGTGLKDLALRNDDQVLDASGTLEPFGPNPHRLAGLYIANDEISRKRLASITFHLEWINLPDSFNSTSGHYKGYKDINGAAIALADTDFQAELKEFDKRALATVDSTDLFGQNTGHTRLNPVSSLEYEFNPVTDGHSNIDLAHPDSDDPFDWARYFKLELSGDHSTFLQDDYHAALQNLEAGQKINQPYNPRLRRITVDYSCAGALDLTVPDTSSAPIRVLQMHPFGQADIHRTEVLTDASGEPGGYRLLPRYDDIGHLYLGIRNLEDKQAMSLLFQVAEGTENSDIDPPSVQWRYLSNDQWIPFNGNETLSDTTEGLLNTGIIRFQPPSSIDETEKHPRPTRSNRLMPDGLHWFQARVPDNVHAFPKTLSILSQAASATRTLQPAGVEFDIDPVPADTVTGPITPIAAIDSVAQPFSSSGGKGSEDERQFKARVSERLRHKGRAVSRWDYERLILERFPEVYKVKCLDQASLGNDPAEARVQLVVVPNLAGRTPFFPCNPGSHRNCAGRLPITCRRGSLRSSILK